MPEKIEELVRAALAAAQRAGELPEFDVADLGLERPADPANGDWSSTVAMRSAKLARRAPRDIAAAVLAHLPADPSIERVEVAGPGFINFYLATDSANEVFRTVREQGRDFARSDLGAGTHVQVEFVSANPVGPLHVGHGRWAALGDSLCRVMELAGYDVEREYYINDHGSQMDVFGRSVSMRYQQLLEVMAERRCDLDAARAALLADREAFVADEEDERPADDNAPFSALAFKIATDPFVGKLCFFRVYSGTIEAGSTVYNSVKDSNERMGRIVQMHANDRKDIDRVYAGDIAAAVGLKNTTTGDTLCDEKHPIILESMEFPDPVIRVAIEPKTKAGQEKMGIALAKLAEEDPTFKAYTDEETGQTIIAGMGELHLEIIVDRLMREFKVEANVGKPQVAYKETIRKNADVDTKYARQSGGKGQYGHVKIRIEPNPEKGYEFVNAVVGGAIPKEYIPAVDQGIQGAMLSGVLAGYNVVDVKVTLYDGSYHEVDSSEMAFKIAGSMAFKEAMRKADPVLMEPIMKVTVITPEEYMGDVIGDLNSRRGMILGMDAIPGAQQVNAEVPLSEMFGYATDMRSKTQGRGQYTMEPAHYAEVPKNISEKIISERGKKSE